MRVLLAGGGTGGHINPALAIAQIIKNKCPSSDFLFAGTPFGLEAKLIPAAGYDFAPISVYGFQRKISVKNIKRNAQALTALAAADKRAGEIINSFAPDLVIGTGGYVSGPIVRKAAKLGIKTAIHEANAFPGATTKILSKYVNAVMLTVEEAAVHLDKNAKWTTTGLPVRKGIISGEKSRETACRELCFKNGLTILSFGGSLGAGKINEVMADVIEWTVKNKLGVNHIHGYGGNGKDFFPQAMMKKGIDTSAPNLKISEYINNMETCIAAADLVICRSGASTLAELQAAGRASILIPSPIVAANHQYFNAKVVENAGGAILIEQKKVTSDGMINILKNLYEQPNKIKTMARKTAALAISDVDERIWNLINEILKTC